MSLKRRADRRFIIRKSFPSHILRQLVFRDAVDAEQLEKRMPRADKVQQMDPRAYSVRLSKIRILRAFVRSNASFLCLYEDDVYLRDGFDRALDVAMNSSGQWDCFFLGGTHHVAPKGSGEVLQCVNIYDNHCVLFDRAGARKVLSHWIRMPHRCRWSDRELAAAIMAGELKASCPVRFVAAQRANFGDNTGERHQGLQLYDSVLAEGLSSDDAHVLHFAVESGFAVVQVGVGKSTGLIRDRTAGLNGTYRGLGPSDRDTDLPSSIDLIHLERVPDDKLWPRLEFAHRQNGLLIMPDQVRSTMLSRLKSYDFHFSTPIRCAAGELHGLAAYLRK